MPVKKVVGGKVTGATINKTGIFQFRATKIGADTALAQIVKLVQAAQNSKAPSQRFADIAAQVLTISAIVFGIATFAIWYWVAGATLVFAMLLAITVVAAIGDKSFYVIRRDTRFVVRNGRRSAQEIGVHAHHAVAATYLLLNA